MNVPLIIALCISMLLLLVSMILAATAAADINDGALNNDRTAISSAYTFATWAAISSGISILVLAVTLVLYLYFNWDSKPSGDNKKKVIDLTDDDDVQITGEKRRRFESPKKPTIKVKTEDEKRPFWK
jgi:hypothetical protein